MIAGATAMAQIERGANRLYGVERDRPFLHKYGVATVLAFSAGVGALLSSSFWSAARRSESMWVDEG